MRTVLLAATSWRLFPNAPMIALLLFPWLVFPWFVVVMVLGLSLSELFLELFEHGGSSSGRMAARDPDSSRDRRWPRNAPWRRVRSWAP